MKQSRRLVSFEVRIMDRSTHPALTLFYRLDNDKTLHGYSTKVTIESLQYPDHIISLAKQMYLQLKRKLNIKHT